MGDRRRNRTLRSPGKEPGTLPLSYAVKLKFKERTVVLICYCDGTKVR